MRLRNTNMAGTLLGTAVSLLFFASNIQALRDVEPFHYETVEAVAGQNITLPCHVENKPGLNVVQIEWKRENNAKLVVHSQILGPHLFRPNVSIQIKNNDEADGIIGYNLHLQGVEKWDSGVYICDITTFPTGSIRREIELKVKDVDKIVCNMNGKFEVKAGENVTIHCPVSPDAQYRWIKDKKLVSESESLELWWVSEVQAGVYALNVNTGNNYLHTEFILTVLTATTSLGTGLTTVSPQTNVTEEGLIQTMIPADIGHTTSPSSGSPSTDTNVTWTMGSSTKVTTKEPHNVTTATGKHTTSLGTFPFFTNRVNISVTSPPATRSQPDRFHNSTDVTVTMTETVRQDINPTSNLNTTPITDESMPSNLSTAQFELPLWTVSNQTTLSDETSKSVPPTMNPEDRPLTRAEEASTLGNTEMNPENAGAPLTVSAGDDMGASVEKAGARSYLVLIIFPILALIALVAILYRRHIIKKRMDLPPPFKPPPPPVKYSAITLHEIPAADTVAPWGLRQLQNGELRAGVGKYVWPRAKFFPSN
ncbi:T-cell surface protein tactile isoform X2 [Centroberyx affinis]|uniref:T-cell surface protein tactile isoform X2 n=1 Tax=Centroberyx affinis TaxID=166261 RepID=UPI003A5C7689